jgi:fatty-acyl-CoA synthase
VLIGGSPLPVSLRNDLRAHGIAAVQSLGMTETSPMIVAATPTPALLAQGEEQAEHILATRQGRSIYGIQRRVVDDEGREVPRDGKSAGALQVRGPWVVDRYYPDIPATDEAGWFDTGDIATLDELGYLRITDREKDVIKSGGEWISSIDLENAVSGCPGVRVAAVIGVAHPHWQERPLMVVEPHAGAELLPEQIRAYLEARVVRWWLPDAIVVADVPVTATGKADKKALRDIYRDHLANL